MNQELDPNYTNICWYCGVVYKSNRSTSKYCCKKHNSLYSKYGPQVKPFVGEKGEVFDFENVFFEIYSTFEHSELDWCGPFILTQLHDYGYVGPVPQRDEVLLIGSFLLAKEARQTFLNQYRYFLKPFTLLTLEEKTRLIIIG